MDIVFRKVAKEFPCELNIIGDGEHAAPSLIKQISHESCDAVLCRRIIAVNIREHTSIPVVSVELSSMDLLKILQDYKNKIKRVVVVRADTAIPDIDTIASVLDMEIYQCTFSSTKGLEDELNSLPANIDLIIGGADTYRFAKHLGIPIINIVDEEEVARRALSNAVEAAKPHYHESNWNVRLNSVLNSINDGLIIVDTHNIVQVINPAAERLLSCKKTHVLERELSQCFPHISPFRKNMDNPKISSELISHKGSSLVVQITPLIVKNSVTGIVYSFSDMVSLQHSMDKLKADQRKRGFQTKYTFDDIFTVASPMEKLKNLGRLYATTDASLLLTGESGTGKELFAQSIHSASKRKDKPFVAVNCAAIPAGLIESELFGYEEGAFTGAKRSGKAGMFELSDGGTLFLDEVGDLPLALQGRLLRVVQEMEIVRVGGTKLIPLDVRIICATHSELLTQVEQGTFRADLYYRLNVLSLDIPPLREHKEDILPLAIPYLINNMENHPEIGLLKREIGQQLLAYDWPGNFRELFSTLERLIIVSQLQAENLSWSEKLSIVWQPRKNKQKNIHSENSVDVTLPQCTPMNLKNQIQEAERKIIMETIKQCNSSYEQAANMLGVSRMTLWRKINLQK